MSEFNPYAPSKASLAGRTSAPAVDTEVKVWRDGKTVVTLLDASLPARCVKCNEPAEHPTKVRTLYYVHPAVYLTFFAGLLILLIVYLIVRKKADVDPGMCAGTSRAVSWPWASPGSRSSAVSCCCSSRSTCRHSR